MAISLGGPGQVGTGFSWGPIATYDPQGVIDFRAQSALEYPQQQKLEQIRQTPAYLQQERFNRVFPWLQNQIGSALGQFSSTVGGQSGQGPTITASPVVGPQQLQQNINAMRARGDMQAQTQARMNARNAAGNGMGAGSPLVSAMNQSAQMSNLAGQRANETNLRMQAATGNAQQMLQAQQAREGQFASRQQEDVERRRTVAGLYPQLLSSISGLV